MLTKTAGIGVVLFIKNGSLTEKFSFKVSFLQPKCTRSSDQSVSKYLAGFLFYGMWIMRVWNSVPSAVTPIDFCCDYHWIVPRGIPSGFTRTRVLLLWFAILHRNRSDGLIRTTRISNGKLLNDQDERLSLPAASLNVTLFMNMLWKEPGMHRARTKAHLKFVLQLLSVARHYYEIA